MKGKFWRKALAAALALLIVSGSTPIQPLSRVINDVTITANAVGSTLSGEGTVESPYVISDAADWATFAANVNAGTNSNAYYKLSDTWDNSVNEVTATVGTESNPFTGTFDGNGKTLTVNINDTSTQGTAPFREISGGAVIKNLTVKGSVAGTTHAAGLVGFSRGGSSESPNTIENCIVNVGVLNPATSGNRHIGGIVGHGVTSYLTIKDTVFGGTMTNSGNYAGGLQGWSDGNHLTIDNCISKGSYSGSGSFHPIAIHNTGSTTTATVNGAYYTEVPTLTNAAQIAAAGTQVSASAPSDVMYGTVTAADNQTYYAPVTVSDINDYYLYTGNEIAIDCTVTAADGSTLTKGTHYTETLSPSTVKEKGEYTLTITGTNGYNGTQTFTFTVGDGIPVTAETTTMTTGTYIVTEDVTIGSRINISGDVKLILGEGTTLTANKGIELSSGNKLTIEGSGTLKATSSSTINKSGIGAQNFGTLIINGGNINATGWIGAAGIGTEAGGTNGGTIIINGGVVTAKGGHFSAGIGGCYNIDSGKSAPAGDITINGGQVHATGMQGSGQSSGIGIGNGYNRNANNGSLTLGWTSQTDFIYSENYNITNISFADGKTFFLDGTSTVATKENIGWKKIVPPTDEIAKNLEYAAISGIDQRYLYTGNTISLGYTLTAVGENLTNGTHFTETLTLGGKTVTEVKEKGTYTLTLTGTAPYTGTKSVTFTVLSEENLGGYAFTFSADDEGTYFAVDKKEALTALASYVNNGNNAAGLRFKQTADIDMQGVGYTPIGKNDTNTFGGIYDGDGYVIMNISHNTNGNIGTSGMFGKIKNGTVKNVNLMDCSFSGTDAGGIAGAMNQGTIDNCTVIGGKVSVGVNDYAGGIMGYFYAGTIKDCFTTTTVNPGGYSAYTGAVAGGSGGSITNCYYTTKPASNYYNHGVKVSGGFITADEGIAVGSGVFRTIGRTAENTHYFGKSGDTITLDSTLPPNTGYHMVYSKDGTALDGKTFTMPESDVNITASQTANFHIVVFDKNNADATGTMDNQSFTYDTAKSLTENNFKRTGYTFKGWNTKADGSGTAYADKAKVSNLTAENNGVVTLYAQWEINKYTVTWKNGDTVLETDENVEYGTTPEYNGETPTKDATAQYTYTFSGWSPAVDAVTGNTEYTAQFDSTVNEYTVTWIDGNGDTLKTEQVAYGETPVYTGDTPTKTSTAQYSYTFTGWDTTPSEVTGNVTYTAQFSETVNQYTVTWKNGDTILETDENVEYGTTPEYNGETPAKDATAQYSYTFSGWSPTVSAITGNAEYTAVFDQTPKEYKVTYMLDGEVYGDVDTVAYGTELTVREAPTREGYTFSGWSEVPATMPDEDVVITGTFSINKYTVTWKNGDTVLETDENVEYGTNPEYNGKTPTKDATAQYSYTFSGWSPAVGAVTGNATYTAQFSETVNQYTVKWVDGDGKTLKTDTLDYGATPSYTGDTPTKTATAQYTYTFKGWDEEISQITGDTTYTAQFDSEVNKYTVTWKNADGTTLETDKNVEYGADPSYDGTTPTKTADAMYSYSFAGWSPSVSPVNGDVTYTAQFNSTANTYTITYKVDGEVYDTKSVSYGDSITLLDAPTREGFTFSGWQTSYTTMPAQDIEITGTFAINQYAVTYMVDGVQYGESLTVDHGTKLTVPEAPTKNGAIFLGWTADGVNAYDFETSVTAETTLTAMWLDASGFITFSEGYAVTDDTYNGTDRDYVGFRFDVNMDNSNYTVVQHGILYGMNVAAFGEGKADANLRFTDEEATALMDKVREFAAQNTDIETTDWIEVYIGDRPEGVVYARGFIIVTDGTNKYLIYSDVLQGSYNSFSE